MESEEKVSWQPVHDFLNGYGWKCGDKSVWIKDVTQFLPEYKINVIAISDAELDLLYDKLSPLLDERNKQHLEWINDHPPQPFEKINLPALHRQFYPSLMANKLVDVQPLKGPASLIYYLRYRYNETKTPIKTPEPETYKPNGWFFWIEFEDAGMNRLYEHYELDCRGSFYPNWAEYRGEDYLKYKGERYMKDGWLGHAVREYGYSKAYIGNPVFGKDNTEANDKFTLPAVKREYPVL